MLANRTTEYTRLVVILVRRVRCAPMSVTGHYRTFGDSLKPAIHRSRAPPPQARDLRSIPASPPQRDGEDGSDQAAFLAPAKFP